jgi:hypothetical protein
VVKVGPDIKLGYLIQAVYSLVTGFTTDTVAFEYTHIKVRPQHLHAKMLACDCDTSRANKRIVDQVTRHTLSLVSHQECKLVVSASRPQIRPLLQTILAKKRVIILTFA